MKILYITTIGSSMLFFKAFIRHLLDDGHSVDIATNENKGNTSVPACYREWGCKVFPLSCTRSPLDAGNVAAIKQIRKIVQENTYDIVHCHTPIAAACTRLACRPLRKKGVKVFYTAHGFHFYKGAPLKNWLMYYPVEKLCSHFTDVLITINREDYALAQKHLHAKRVEYVPGVGIDLSKFGQAAVDKVAKRRELGIPHDATLLISVGELNANKNHETVIRAITGLDVYYIIAGEGNLREHLQRVIDELGLTERVKLLGYRTDVVELYRAADICVFPSFREGLGMAAIEGMTCGLPLVAADNRGTRDYCRPGVNGLVCQPSDAVAFADAIKRLSADACLRLKMAEANAEAVKKFDIILVNEQMDRLYQRS